jgi:hypothetical protein
MNTRKLLFLGATVCALWGLALISEAQRNPESEVPRSEIPKDLVQQLINQLGNVQKCLHGLIVD